MEDLFARATGCRDFICTRATPSNPVLFLFCFSWVISEFYDGKFSGLSYCAGLFCQRGSHGYILLLCGSWLECSRTFDFHEIVSLEKVKEGICVPQHELRENVSGECSRDRVFPGGPTVLISYENSPKDIPAPPVTALCGNQVKNRDKGDSFAGRDDTIMIVLYRDGSATGLCDTREKIQIVLSPERIRETYRDVSDKNEYLIP